MALAVRTLAILAVHPDGALTTDRLGGLLDTNPVVIRRLLGRLRWDGVVETRRGHGGGCALALDPERITLGRLHRALAPEVDTSGLAVTLASALRDAEESYAAQLDRWRLADVMDVSFPGPFATTEVTNGPGMADGTPSTVTNPPQQTPTSR